MEAEGLAAAYLSNKDDKTLLTWKEVKEEFGSWTEFMLAYGLKPYNIDDCKEAVEISRYVEIMYQVLMFCSSLSTSFNSYRGLKESRRLEDAEFADREQSEIEVRCPSVRMAPGAAAGGPGPREADIRLRQGRRVPLDLMVTKAMATTSKTYSR